MSEVERMLADMSDEGMPEGTDAREDVDWIGEHRERRRRGEYDADEPFAESSPNRPPVKGAHHS
jgi:hypothetical protein